MIKNFEELKNKALDSGRMVLSVAAAADETVIAAVEKARKIGIIDVFLVGDKRKIAAIAEEMGVDIKNYEVIDEEDVTGAARTAVKLVHDGQADFVMKGILGTSDLLKSVLDEEIGLRGKNLLSHIMVYNIPAYHKLLMVTDGGMVISPTMEEKAGIIQNAVELGRALDIEPLKVAALCAVETVNPKMQATVDAKELSEKSKRGEIEGAIVEGPLAFDLAISKEAARHKGVAGEVVGDADCLLVPYIEVGNSIGKCLSYFGGAQCAGIVMGARKPIVLVSRADPPEDKFNSIVLGCVIASNR
ncbi:bifunctional enoyl-CoA hydratase/phosphate acetyltransferase [Calorimonas adulescens]|uniref:Bifunctional enoyl-CoA hydratase/phosphate acetyltransferase n=1 Tax=Calorimonas adulescens TaxID=2606906 RepID=A0A5D8Q9S4_9THEO|nr:bifunctional enoyl-CoA hydratase/phosphate acetyltransferase [Calorimonas adulescens]